MPEVEEAPHIINWLCELGLYGAGFNGPSVLTFGEIDSWSRLTGTALRADEVTLIRSLSSTFCGFYRDCEEGTPEPMAVELTEQERLKQMKSIRQARRMRIANPSK